MAAIGELGCKSTYELAVELENVPVITGFHIKDIREVALFPWERMGGQGVYLNLEGSGGVNDAYICEIPPGGALKPQRHLFEELTFIVSGHGATTVWREGGNKQTFEWQKGSLFSPPLNAWYQHFNGEGNMPVRFLSMTNAPIVMNLFHNIDFVFNCEYAFTDRYNGESDFFSNKGKALSAISWETNFVQDVRTFRLNNRKGRGAEEKVVRLEIANNLMASHITEFPVGTYKKAHRHGPGAHVVILDGEGYSLMWPEGEKISRYDWHQGSLIVPPADWFHQHFNVGAQPAKYLALKPFSSRKFPGLAKQFGAIIESMGKEHQIEYADEDPQVRKMFENELAKRNVPSRMEEVFRECL
jgi:quercetin dioxygenase-like cupin family protein